MILFLNYEQMKINFFFFFFLRLALRDYEGAIKLDPKNDALRADAFKIRRTLQGGDSSD